MPRSGGIFALFSLIYPPFRLGGIAVGRLEAFWIVEVRPFAYNLAELGVARRAEVGEVYVVAYVEVGQHRVEAYVESLQLVVADVQSLEECLVAEVNISKVIPFKVYECEVRHVCYGE